MAEKLNVAMGRTADGDSGQRAEAALLVLANSLQKHSVGRIAVFSRDSATAPGTLAVGSTEMPVSRNPLVWSVLPKTSVFVWAGGEFFHDGVSVWETLLDALRIRWPVLLGNSVMLYGVETGPISGTFTKLVARWCLSHKRLVSTVLDEQSARALRECGVPAGRVVLAADPAFALTADTDAAMAVLRSTGVAPGEPIAVIAPRGAAAKGNGFLPDGLMGMLGIATDHPHDPDALAMRLAEAADYIAARHATRVLLIATDPGEAVQDLEMCRRILSHCTAGKMVVAPHRALAAPVVKGLLESARFIISMRLYPMTIACGAGLPFIGLCDSAAAGKCERLLHDAGMPGLLLPILDLLADGGIQRLAGLVEHAVEHRDELSGKLRAFAAQQAKLSEASNRVLAVLIDAHGMR